MSSLLFYNVEHGMRSCVHIFLTGTEYYNIVFLSKNKKKSESYSNLKDKNQPESALRPWEKAALDRCTLINPTCHDAGLGEDL
jgi:hypothetical protein